MGSKPLWRIATSRMTLQGTAYRFEITERTQLPSAYTTLLVSCSHSDALDIFCAPYADSASRIFTSPPYALRRKKAYGNVSSSEYLDWFLPFTQEIHRILRPDGSFLFEIAPAWQQGTGTRSLFLYEIILELCKTFHLVQE